MFKHVLLLACVAAFATGNAQTTIHQISAGAGYAKAGYYKFSDGSNQQVAHDAWDLAFSNLGPQQAGIFVNESATTATAALELYDSQFNDFNEVIDPTLLAAEQRLFNPEASWAEGAFNTLRNPANPFDFGWGTYNPAQFKVVGDRVFVLKLRNGQYRKLIIDEYNGQKFTFRIANLDGTNVETKTATTAFGNGSPVVYFSLANANPVIPTTWDMVFCRYSTPLFDGTGYIPYSVTGILTGDGVKTAKATGVDPATVNYQDYVDSLKTRLDVIGYEWKSFSGTAWVIPGDVAYFVKTKDNKLYKLVFLDFEGSSTGTGTFERTYLGELSATSDLPDGIQSVLVYPNPVADQLNVSFTAEIAAPASLQLINTAGQVMWSGTSRTQFGLNVLEINDLPSLPAGSYVLSVQLPTGQFSQKIMVGAR